MKSFFVEKEIGDLHYLQVGSGEQVMLCFPGFGQTAYTFSRLLSSKLRERYTFYVIDLFYEGRSVLKKNEILTQQDCVSIVGTILKRHAVQSYKILAYSIGARMALCLPDVTDMILIAPDGIKNRWVYKLIAYNKKLGDFLLWLSFKLNWLTKSNESIRKWTRPTFVYKIVKIWRSLSLLPNVEVNASVSVYIGTKDIVAHNRSIKKWVGQSNKRELFEFDKAHFPLLVTVLKTKI